MKRFALILAIFSFSRLPAHADEIIPRRPDFSHFEPMLKRSPFAVATAVETSATPDFAKDLYIANAAHSAGGDIATIASSTDRNFKKYPTTKNPDDGYGITHIEWSDRVGETKVTITKDGKYATLAFNQALLLQPVGGGGAPQAQLQLPIQPAINPLAPAAIPFNPSYPKPAPIPSLPPQALVPPPGANIPPNRIRSRGVIQRNPAVAIPTPVPTPVPDTEEEEN